MSALQRVVKLHFTDRWSWFLLPWLIVFLSFFINITVALFVNDALYTGGLSSFYGYMFAIGIITLAQMFPFALGFSVRRTDFFWGTTATVTLMSAACTIVLLLLSFVEKLTGAWGVDVHFFHLPYVNDGTVIEQLFIYFTLMVHMYFFGFVIASVYQRFGKVGMLTFFIVTFLTISVCTFIMTYNAWWGELFGWFSRHSAFELALWTVPVTAIYMCASYAMLRRASV